LDGRLSVTGGHSLESAVASEAVRARYRQLTGQGVAEDLAADVGGRARQPVEGDCPICFDELKVSAAWC